MNIFLGIVVAIVFLLIGVVAFAFLAKGPE